MKLGSKKKKYTSYSEEKKKKKNLRYIAVGVATAGITISLYQFVLVDYYVTRTRENTIQEITNESGEYVQAYKLKKDLVKGTSITIDDIEKITQNQNIVPDNYISSPQEVLGMVTRIDLSAKSVLTKDMVIKLEEQITDSLKNQDFDWIRVHAFMQIGDFVDIHYKELDGTDTIVASKRRVNNLSGSLFAMDITEEERAYINNATVKAAVTGGELYTTIYPEPENQKPATVTYILDKAIEEKIKNDPNIVNKAVDVVKNPSSYTDMRSEVNGVEENKIIVDKPVFIGGE